MLINLRRRHGFHHSDVIGRRLTAMAAGIPDPHRSASASVRVVESPAPSGVKIMTAPKSPTLSVNPATE